MNRCAVAALALVAMLAVPSMGFAKILPMTDAMAVIDVVHANLANSEELDISLVAEGSYAVAFWKAEKGHTAGTALLKNTPKGWVLVKMRPTHFTAAADLEALGVSTSVASALMTDLHKQGGA
jgi:hypothetical protein